MKKNYVLDANVLLHDPHAIFKFEDNDLIIPIFAIEEVDQFKREGSERGRNARTIARLLDDLRRIEGSSLSRGVHCRNAARDKPRKCRLNPPPSSHLATRRCPANPASTIGG